MLTNCTIYVINANREPIKNANISIGILSEETGIDGSWSKQIESVLHNSIEVSHPYYVNEKISFDGDIRSTKWNNSLLNRRVTESGVFFTITLGRIDTSPTAELSKSQTNQIATIPPYDPGAVLTFRSPRFPELKAYLDQWNDQRTIFTALPELLPKPALVNPPKGWKRFVTKEEPVDLPALGRFFWLEYPKRPSSPKTLVAIWSPNISALKPVDMLDFIVFFSPHTLAFTAKFPYGLVAGTQPPDQQYMSLGKKYLVSDYFFVHQLLARRNRSILVMPICNKGDWGPFTCGEGLLRLLNEVSVFLHRQCRTSQLGVIPPSANSETLAGFNQRNALEPLVSDFFGDFPKIGQVCVSAFSTGIGNLKQVISNWPISKFDRIFWGVINGNGRSPEQVWKDAWRELWDLDGFHPDTGGWSPYLDLLSKWYTDNRILRLYHSSSRVPPDPMSDNHRIYKLMLKDGIKLDREVPSSPGIGGGRIIQGDRWTVVRMDDTYVNHGPDNETPHFTDAHHTTPLIGFSHAVGLTKLGK